MFGFLSMCHDVSYPTVDGDRITLHIVGRVDGLAEVFPTVHSLHPLDGVIARVGIDRAGVEVGFATGGIPIPLEGDGRRPAGNVTDEDELGALFNVVWDRQGCQQGFTQRL